MNLRGTRTREDPEINFIPLIDVLLVILIFLMVTTTYQRISELQITLPEADADAAKQRPREVNIGVDAQGRYVVDKTVFTFTTAAALADTLKRAAGDAKDPVVIITAGAVAGGAGPRGARASPRHGERRSGRPDTRAAGRGPGRRSADRGRRAAPVRAGRVVDLDWQTTCARGASAARGQSPRRCADRR